MYKKIKYKLLLSCISVFLFMSICLAPLTLASDAVFVWSNNQDKSVETATNASTGENQTEATGNFLNLTSGGAVLMEQNSGKVLYEHNMHEKLRPASVTKVMTLLLIMEAIDDGRMKYDDKIACSENAAGMGGSQIWLDVREELTVDEMLKAICVVSANDCTVAMAEYLAGSEEAFVGKMNERARALGMNDTTFKNCHGIDEDGHLTSAHDIAIMSKELLSKHPDVTKYTTIWMDSLRDGKSQLVNTNKLVRTYTGTTGLKTGSTSIALYNLSASATKNNLNLIAVTMKSDTSATRFAEAKKLLDYGFSTYSYKEFAKAGEVVNTINVEKGVLKSINAIYENNSGSLMKKGQEGDIKQEIQLETSVTAPILKGQKIGEAIYKLGDDVVGRTNIVAQEEVKKLNLINSMSYIYWCWFTLYR